MPEKLNLSFDFGADANKNTEKICEDPFYTERNLAHLRRGIAALNAGEGKEHEVLADEDNAAIPNKDRPRR